MEQEKFMEPFKDELQELANDPVLSKAYQKKKLFFWLIRNVITAIICYIFWEKSWVKWVLWIGIPIALASLLIILLGPILLRKKMKAVQKRISAMDQNES